MGGVVGSTMLRSIQKVQVCDARDGDSSKGVGDKNITRIIKFSNCQLRYA